MGAIGTQPWHSIPPLSQGLLLPVLYSTRTILRPRPCYPRHRRHQRCRAFSSALHLDRSRHDDDAETNRVQEPRAVVRKVQSSGPEDLQGGRDQRGHGPQGQFSFRSTQTRSGDAPEGRFSLGRRPARSSDTSEDRFSIGRSPAQSSDTPGGRFSFGRPVQSSDTSEDRFSIGRRPAQSSDTPGGRFSFGRPVQSGDVSEGRFSSGRGQQQPSDTSEDRFSIGRSPAQSSDAPKGRFSFGRRQTPSSVEPEQPSTMTAMERRVFGKIFSRLAVGGGSRDSGRPGQQALESKSPIDPEEILSAFSQASASGGQAAAVPGQKHTTLTEEDERHIQRYPQLLRSIAARATLLAKAQSGSNVSSNGDLGEAQPGPSQPRQPATTTEADFLAAENDFEVSAASNKTIDSFCATYMQRTSELLVNAAKVSDRELWVTAQRNVLNLPSFLEADKDAARAAVADSEPDPELQLPCVSTTADWQCNPLGELPAKLHLPTISTLYPALVLLTLRIFTTHYPLSPFPINFRSYLRQLGLKAYVLGTSTHLFNTLLSHRWDIYSDLNGMAVLLQEMENGGIAFDADTLAVLERVRAERKMDEREERRAKGKTKSGVVDGDDADPSTAEAETPARFPAPPKTGITQKRKSKMTKEERKASGVPLASIERGPGARRAQMWWHHVDRVGVFERVVGGWRQRVMEQVRLRRDRDQTRAGGVVEREYAESLLSSAGSG